MDALRAVITAPVLESLNRGGGLTLSDIAVRNAPAKYSLSNGGDCESPVEIIGGTQGLRVYSAEGTAITRVPDRAAVEKRDYISLT